MVLSMAFSEWRASCIMAQVTAVQPTLCNCRKNSPCIALHKGLASGCVTLSANVMKNGRYSLHTGAPHIPPIPYGIVQRAAFRPAAAGYLPNAAAFDAVRLFGSPSTSMPTIHERPARSSVRCRTSEMPSMAALGEARRLTSDDREAGRSRREPCRSGPEAGRSKGEAISGQVSD
jgi:hypothetical protein